jgi:E3 ubiquitin-protein ligase UBR1
MIAQIRTGLWVRNGFAIRGQLLHYRDFMLRELCYDQDIFILQTALVILDPNTVIVTILDRFGLLGYFGGITLHPVYDGSQLASMVEEVLYILITIFSETANASRMSLPLVIRREIIHALGMGPCSFSDLVKRVAERLADDVSFEHVLKEVANFRSPESTFDTGVYELKDECFGEINPFFYHYTRNKREEVEAVLVSRMKKAGIAEPVIVPKPLGITQGPFSILGSVFESEALLQVMFYAILNVVTVTEAEGETASSGEAILDQVLHLIMLAIIERAPVFCSLATVKDFQDNKTLLDVLCSLETHERFKAYKPRIRWILNEMEKISPEQVAQHRQVINATEGDDPESAKKKAAKARQEAIMKQMKAQQASFAINFDDVEDDEDDAMGEEAEEQTSFGTCIVCQEDLDNTRAFGTLGLIQPSRFIRRHLDGHHNFLSEALQTPSSLDRTEPSPKPTFPPPDADRRDAEYFSSPDFQGFPSHHTKFGLHCSVCTHMMHLECFQMYNASTKQRHRAQTSRNHPENIARKEFICPLCKSLGNVLLPVSQPSTVVLSTTSFPDWIRAAGISILKSRPDFQLDSLQFRNGTGEFGFWSAQDPGYMSVSKKPDRWDNMDEGKMVDFVMSASKTISQQTRHLRDRPEPEQGERGAGIYLPEELVGYTIASTEIAQRGVDAGSKLLVDTLTDAQMRMIRSLLMILTKLMGSHLKGRPDEGREAVRQAIIKRLLPEWSRTSLTSFAYPLLLRDPFTILVETAAVGPDMLKHVLALTFHACLARTVIGLVYILNKTRGHNTVQIPRRAHEAIFGDLRIFFMSVVRHSPVFEHTATLVYETFGDARMERLLYAFTLPFLRRAAILCRSVLPNAFPTPEFDPSECEYTRLLKFLGIPPLADLPKQDTLQNALSGWCAHYGHSHAASQLNCGVMLDFPGVYKIARLPLILDSLFGSHDQALKCKHCSNVPADAAICLICGTTVCMASHCCQDPDAIGRGECNVHTRESVSFLSFFFLGLFHTEES